MGEPLSLHVRCHQQLGALALQVDVKTVAAWSVIFGPSGSGKTSLLRLLSGLWTPEGSTVLLGQEALHPLPAHRRRVALVAQQPALFPHLTAAANVEFARGKHAAESTETLLARFHAAHLASKFPRQLSGGEMQRVSIARAVASQPRVLLLDEAFSGLETALRTELTAALKQWQETPGALIVSVTHDVSEACAVAGDVIRMEGGRILAQGPAHIVLAEERAHLRAQFSASPG